MWIKLRDAYRSSLKRLESRSGDGGSATKPWKFQEQMAFLKPHMKDRKRCTNEDVSRLNEVDDIGETVEVTKDNADELAHNAATSSNESGIDRPSKKKKNDVASLLVDLTRGREERMKGRDELRRQLLQPPDELKLFFDSMYESTKKLHPSLQRMVKKSIFAAVNEAEDIDEKNKEPSQNYNYPGPSLLPQERSSSCPSQCSTGSESHMFPNEYYGHLAL
ncbi:hypothetical protein PPYR_02391 [Photinus pyralis]|uniref:Uncharacterized protein n=1 Tax=Photinus pyralis TaxID=7054 RepID=A0A5N4B731_PHOPY|nr:hypothetical protein PPYR_02391 [Photinus pyralis]